jgi:coenzyme Q-binding protein COQ10
MPSHAERKFLPYRRDDMFALVADVAKYPEFLPWCIAARVRPLAEQSFEADLVIGFKMVRETFTSRVDLNPPDLVDVTYTKGPMRHLNNRWLIEEAEGGCIVDFKLDFEFKSVLLRKLIGPLFGEAVRRMVAAFEARASEICERAS